MKTTLTLLAAIVLPGGFLLLAVGAASYLAARHRARGKAAGPALLA